VSELSAGAASRAWRVGSIPTLSFGSVEGLLTGESKMLVLSRKLGEKIVISDEIEVTIEDIRGGKVRVGIKAPRDIAVHRSEVYELIKSKEQESCPQ